MRVDIDIMKVGDEIGVASRYSTDGSTNFHGHKGGNGSWFAIANNQNGHSKNPVHAFASEGLKIGGDWFSDPESTCRKHGSKSKARKAASAAIAKIPFPLASYIARVYRPSTGRLIAEAIDRALIGEAT